MCSDKGVMLQGHGSINPLETHINPHSFKEILSHQACLHQFSFPTVTAVIVGYLQAHTTMKIPIIR